MSKQIRCKRCKELIGLRTSLRNTIDLRSRMVSRGCDGVDWLDKYYLRIVSKIDVLEGEPCECRYATQTRAVIRV